MLDSSLQRRPPVTHIEGIRHGSESARRNSNTDACTMMQQQLAPCQQDPVQYDEADVGHAVEGDGGDCIVDTVRDS